MKEKDLLFKKLKKEIDIQINHHKKEKNEPAINSNLFEKFIKIKGGK